MPRLLKDWVETYLEYTQYNEAPLNFHFWTAISVIAGALRRKVKFDQLYYCWPCNFYIVFVARPGIATKSTTIDFGMKLLRELDGPKFGPDAITWQAMTVALQEATEMVPMELGNPNSLQESMSCLTFAASELGTLLDPNDDKLLSVLIEFWDGKTGTFRKWTKFSGREEVVNPWVNIIACTTPVWIATNMPKAAIGGGFASRCIFVYEDHKRNYVAYPRRNIPKDADMPMLREKLIHDLEQIAMIRGEYTLTEEAYRWGEEWYVKHWKAAESNGMDDDQLVGYMARKQGHIHKLAMAIHAARSDDMVIPRSTLEACAETMTNFESHIPKVFQQINTTPTMDLTLRVAETVRRSAPRISNGTLYRIFMRQVPYREWDDLLTSCIRAGLIRSTNYGGIVYLEPVDQEEKKAVVSA